MTIPSAGIAESLPAITGPTGIAKCASQRGFPGLLCEWSLRNLADSDAGFHCCSQ